MKAVLISIKPKYVELIASGEKTIEVRKTRPKIDRPFKVYIYCTKAKEVVDIGKTFSWGKEVIGEFVCDSVYEWKYSQLQGLNGTINTYFPIFVEDLLKTCFTLSDELWEYGKGKTLYGWHISNLKIYDKPKELSEFKKHCHSVGVCYKCEDNVYWGGKCDGGCIERPPQSWCYIEENENEN